VDASGFIAVYADDYLAISDASRVLDRARDSAGDL